MCSHILHNICDKLVGTRGGGGGGREMISHSIKCDVWASPNISVGFSVCSLKNLFFQYNEIISTIKLPFHNPLVKKYYNVWAYFSLDYEKCPFTKFSW